MPIMISIASPRDFDGTVGDAILTATSSYPISDPAHHGPPLVKEPASPRSLLDGSSPWLQTLDEFPHALDPEKKAAKLTLLWMQASASHRSSTVDRLARLDAGTNQHRRRNSRYCIPTPFFLSSLLSFSHLPTDPSRVSHSLTHSASLHPSIPPTPPSPCTSACLRAVAEADPEGGCASSQGGRMTMWEDARRSMMIFPIPWVSMVIKRGVKV